VEVINLYQAVGAVSSFGNIIARDTIPLSIHFQLSLLSLMGFAVTIRWKPLLN
jgi:hypothetical protein